jgi:dienelactone hydrolase
MILFYQIDAQSYDQAKTKTSIDTNALDKWPEIVSPKISNDGKYSLYIVQPQFLSAGIRNSNQYRMLHVVYNSDQDLVSASNRKELKIDDVISEATFSEDSKQVYFMKGKDSLGVLKIKTRTVDYISGVTSFATKENSHWLAFLTNRNHLILMNISTGRTSSFDSVKNYEFSGDGRILLIKTEKSLNNKGIQSLLWVELSSQNAVKIWQGENISWNSCIFDLQCRRLAFIGISDKCVNPGNSVYYFQEGAQQSEVVVNDQCAGMEGGLITENQELKFSRDGDKILFAFKKPVQHRSILNREFVDLDIWNYKDEYLQSDQLRPGFIDRLNTIFIAAINIADKRLVRLNMEGEEVVVPEIFENYVLVDKSFTCDVYYNISYARNLVSTQDGTRIFISDKRMIGSFFSPDERFYVWFDYVTHQHFSYEIASMKKRSITAGISVPLDDNQRIVHNIIPLGYGIAGWQPDTHSVFVYDKYDIWKVDLLGKEIPINITNGLGRKNSVVFTVVEHPPQQGAPAGYSMNSYRTLRAGEQPLLAGFNIRTKANGFWQMRNVDLASDPIMLRMDSSYYCGRVDGGPVPFTPVNARWAKTYLVMNQSATAFPNLYVTADFKNYHAVSDIHPEKNYNWLTTELITWKMADGDMSQGILYKPENFDPTKRYPVIFLYYVKQSNELNKYIRPDWCTDEINVPYFVSNGYLVFKPDIYYKSGRNGQSVVNSVVSAAQYLSRLPFVDSTKMGLNGHSFAGWETNYLVTHSHVFAAACAVSGVADQISNFNELSGAGSLFPASYLEIINPGDPYGAGMTPSTRPDLYEDNSPVLAVENASTPLLVASGNLDEGVPIDQDIEMYLAMRRAGKKVWLLQYEKDGHSFFGKNAKDYTVRVKQFFDYYLKGSPPPIWMTVGRAADLKGIDDGLGIDSSGKIP